VGAIRLGKIHLRWCTRCNVPVIEQDACGVCGEKTRAVRLTPPGDARPAFDFDLHELRVLIDAQFGDGAGIAALPEGCIVLLNKAPDIDRMDEVIAGGEVVGAIRFSLMGGNKFLPRPRSAAAIAPVISRNWVRVDPGAVEAIRNKKASTLAVGVLECSPEISPGDDVIVLDDGGRPVSVGVAKLSSGDMMAPGRRGTAVKTRWPVAEDETSVPRAEASWDDVLTANREMLSRRTTEAGDFIREIVGRNHLPVAVSYSGGKDSLATLLLVLDAGIRPSLIFIDTGLEFTETKDNVEKVAADYSLELFVESAGDAFWKNLGQFGPPARDYRWCCKTCKLGPATRLIQKNFPGGVLSFIGQRAYESEQRARKGSVWRNPWTPNQLGASPIQKWTAMHVWLYIFSKHAKYNPLYERGFDRIGCFMCPATDMAELQVARGIGGDYPRWQAFLEKYSADRGMPEQWLAHDLWRWKRVPASVMGEIGCAPDDLRGSTVRDDAGSEPLQLRTTEGYSPCVDGLSVEGVFNRELDMERVSNLLNILGEVTLSPDGRIVEVDRMTVFAEGPIMIRAKNEHELREKLRALREVVFKAMECAGCGICVARCPSHALRLDGRIEVDIETCTHCGSCLGQCPVVAFREDDLDF
jgi:phosphoadenosine phosphosulfate reductase